jgi:hypothetical protein
MPKFSIQHIKRVRKTEHKFSYDLSSVSSKEEVPEVETYEKVFRIRKVKEIVNIQPENQRNYLKKVFSIRKVKFGQVVQKIEQQIISRVSY